MTQEEHTARVSTLITDYPEMTRSTAHAIACDHYTAEELLELKRTLGLDQDEFIETVMFIEQRGGLDRNEVGNNQKPVDVERSDGRGNSNPEEVEEGLDDA